MGVENLPFRFRGDRLRELRQQRGWSQTRLAELAGVSQRSVSDYESGGHQPQTWDIVVRLSVALGVNPHYLTGDVDDPAYKKSNHVPPDWLHVVNRAMELGFTPEGALRILEAVRVGAPGGQPERGQHR